MSASVSSRFKKLPLYLLVTGITLLPLVFSQSTLDPTLAPRFTFLGILIALLGLSFFLAKEKIRLPILLLPFLCFLAFEILSLTQAINYLEGFWTIVKDAALLTFLVLAVNAIQKRHALDFISKAFIISNGIIGFYALYQLFSTQAIFHSDLLYEVQSTMAHRNLLASALLITFPFLIYQSWKSKGWWKWLSLVLAAHSCFLIFILESRSSWLGLVFFVLSYVSWTFFQKVASLKGIAFWRRVGGMLFVSVLILFSIIYFTNNSGGKGEEIKSGMGFTEVDDRTFTIDERVMLWKGTLRMVWNENFFGVGANNWKIVFPSYGSDIWRARQGMVQFQRPHNDYLWVLSETGIIGLLLYLSCFVVVVFSGLRFLARDDQNGDLKILVKLILSGVSAYMVVAFFSFPRERIFHQVVLYSFFAVIVSLTKESKSKRAFSQVHFIWIALMGVFISYAGYEWWRGEILARKINHQRSVGNWNGLLETYTEAENFHWYKMDATSVPLSFYSGLAYLNLEDFERSLSEFHVAYNQHPNNIHVINNLANAFYLKGDVDSAVVYYKEALEVSPKYLDGVLNLMAAYFNSGRVEEAYIVLREYEKAFKIEMPNHPTLGMYRAAILESMYKRIQEIGNTSFYIEPHELEKLHFESMKRGESLEEAIMREKEKFKSRNDTSQF